MRLFVVSAWLWMVGLQIAPDQGELTRLRLTLDDNSRRITKLEEIKELASRLAVLEDNMSEVKWLSRTVTAAFVVQLVVLGLGAKKRQNGKPTAP